MPDIISNASPTTSGTVAEVTESSPFELPTGSLRSDIDIEPERKSLASGSDREDMFSTQSPPPEIYIRDGDSLSTIEGITASLTIDESKIATALAITKKGLGLVSHNANFNVKIETYKEFSSMQKALFSKAVNQFNTGVNHENKDHELFSLQERYTLLTASTPQERQNAAALFKELNTLITSKSLSEMQTAKETILAKANDFGLSASLIQAVKDFENPRFDTMSILRGLEGHVHAALDNEARNLNADNVNSKLHTTLSRMNETLTAGIEALSETSATSIALLRQQQSIFDAAFNHDASALANIASQREDKSASTADILAQASESVYGKVQHMLYESIGTQREIRDILHSELKAIEPAQGLTDSRMEVSRLVQLEQLVEKLKNLDRKNVPENFRMEILNDISKIYGGLDTTAAVALAVEYSDIHGNQLMTDIGDTLQTLGPRTYETAEALIHGFNPYTHAALIAQAQDTGSFGRTVEEHARSIPWFGTDSITQSQQVALLLGASTGDQRASLIDALESERNNRIVNKQWLANASDSLEDWVPALQTIPPLQPSALGQTITDTLRSGDPADEVVARIRQMVSQDRVYQNRTEALAIEDPRLAATITENLPAKQQKELFSLLKISIDPEIETELFTALNSANLHDALHSMQKIAPGVLGTQQLTILKSNYRNKYGVTLQQSILEASKNPLLKHSDPLLKDQLLLAVHGLDSDRIVREALNKDYSFLAEQIAKVENVQNLDIGKAEYAILLSQSYRNSGVKNASLAAITPDPEENLQTVYSASMARGILDNVERLDFALQRSSPGDAIDAHVKEAMQRFEGTLRAFNRSIQAQQDPLKKKILVLQKETLASEVYGLLESRMDHASVQEMLTEHLESKAELKRYKETFDIFELDTLTPEASDYNEELDSQLAQAGSDPQSTALAIHEGRYTFEQLLADSAQFEEHDLPFAPRVLAHYRQQYPQDSLIKRFSLDSDDKVESAIQKLYGETYLEKVKDDISAVSTLMSRHENTEAISNEDIHHCLNAIRHQGEFSQLFLALKGVPLSKVLQELSPDYEALKKKAPGTLQRLAID